MKRIIQDLKKHVREDFSTLKYALIISGLGILITCNYYFDVEHQVLAKLDGPGYLLYFLLFYPAVFYLTVLVKSGTKAFTQGFLMVSGVYILALAVNSGFTFYRDWVESWPLYEKYYLRNLIANSQGLIFTFVPLGLIYMINERKHLPNFYGLTLENHNFKPYLTLLLLMVPLILLAATQADFLDSYPSLKSWNYKEVFGLTLNQMQWLYELVYLSDFIRVEALFRGALVIGLARFLGKDSVLIMATLYCVLHFNKPLGETISSFFGGYLLGTISYYQKNIVGGCIVHAGIAGLMEFVAYAVHTF